MNPLAHELNEAISRSNPQVLSMLSQVGRELFFPKGILTQGAEAREKAHRINATIGIAKESGHTMRFDTIMAGIHGIRASESLTYAPSFGLPKLRQHWKSDLYLKNPSLAGKEVSLPVVTCGITHGISVFADLWVDPGDVIILPEKSWGNYNLIFSTRHQARLSTYSLFDHQGGYHLAALEAALKKEARGRKKVIVLLNFPQNPTGYTITENEARAMENILLRAAEGGTQVIVLLDDAYFGLFYEDQILKESLFGRLCDRHPNLLAVKVDGATKENFVWGLRVGFVTYGSACRQDAAAFYEALEKKTAGCVRGTISNASHLGQTILLHSMQSPANPAEKEAKFSILKHRALTVKKVLASPKYTDAWEAYPFNSGYFMCVRLKTVAAEPLRLHLLERYGVGLISLGQHDLRIAFSCIDEGQIEELFDTVFKGIKDLETAV
jgi:aspartate/methionine/tyrosine aminotransferase